MCTFKLTRVQCATSWPNQSCSAPPNSDLSETVQSSLAHATRHCRSTVHALCWKFRAANTQTGNTSGIHDCSMLNSAQSAGLCVRALDAAQPFDFEARAAAKLKASTSLKIGIVGFGTFGQFLAARITKHGHKVRVQGLFLPCRAPGPLAILAAQAGAGGQHLLTC